MLRVCTCFVTGLQELLLGDFQLCHKLTEQLIDQLAEGLQIGVILLFLLTSWITVYSNLFSSSVSKIIQLSSTKLMTGVTQRGLLRKFMIMSKNQS